MKPPYVKMKHHESTLLGGFSPHSSRMKVAILRVYPRHSGTPNSHIGSCNPVISHSFYLWCISVLIQSPYVLGQHIPSTSTARASLKISPPTLKNGLRTYYGLLWFTMILRVVLFYNPHLPHVLLSLPVIPRNLPRKWGTPPTLCRVGSRPMLESSWHR